jgi:anti-sigma factor RsiW
MNMQWQEQVDAYLQGSLPEEEKQHFEKLLQTNADLSEEVEMHRLMVEAICAERKAALKRLLDNTPVPQGHTFDWLSAQWWRWGAGVACARAGAVKRVGSYRACATSGRAACERRRKGIAGI